MTMTEYTVISTVEITAICHGQIRPKEEIAELVRAAIDDMIECDNVNVAKVQIFERDLGITEETVAALEKIGEMTHSEI
jgi:hypothetical protein